MDLDVVIRSRGPWEAAIDFPVVGPRQGFCGHEIGGLLVVVQV